MSEYEWESARTREVVQSRRARCRSCGVEGVWVDTTAGEIVLSDGDVVAAPSLDRHLMVGRVDGSQTGSLLCELCADD